tara:strand:+ start:1367 stop:2044 length:678 start_codon:yes stop_codon:yes gene_type:complete
MALIVVLAVFLSWRLVPTASADEVCLRIALPEATRGGFGLEIYRDVMREVGVCVKPVRMPNARAVAAMQHGDIDGVFAVLDEFEDLVGVPMVRGNVLVGNPQGLLVVRDGTINELSDLTDQEVGIWLGASWSEALLGEYKHVVRCPGGPQMMQNMLARGRIDAMLINGFSLEVLGGVPDGFVSIPVMNLPVYSWLHADHASNLTQFDKGTELFRNKIVEWREKAL